MYYVIILSFLFVTTLYFEKYNAIIERNKSNFLFQIRKGVLPRLLDEILSTRIMVKQAMKKLSPSEKVLHRVKSNYFTLLFVVN